MHYQPSAIAIAVFCFFTLGVLALSFYLGRRAKSAAGYFAAHGQVPWFVNGVAFAGDYLSAASFLGICGMIAFYGYDGFLYSIGFLAGWVVALFVIAEPIRKLGKYTFADAVDASFKSRGVRTAAAISTLVVSLFYLIPQMTGAGSLVKPLLGLDNYLGVLIVGFVVILIVVTAGMVSTTWVQFIKGAMLVIFCFILVMMLLNRGLTKKDPAIFPRTFDEEEFAAKILGPGGYDAASIVAPTGGWIGKPYLRLRDKTGHESVWRFASMRRVAIDWTARPPKILWIGNFTECQIVTKNKTTGAITIDGKPHSPENDYKPTGFVLDLGSTAGVEMEDGGVVIPPSQTARNATGPIGPVDFLTTITNSAMSAVAKEEIKETTGDTTTVYFIKSIAGEEVMSAGGSPNFKTLSQPKEKRSWKDQLNFISLMLALFCGTASLPHILIRYYTVKDAAAARKSTVIGILAIGAFYVLTLFLGLGAMASGNLDITDSNMAAPLLARTFGEIWFAVISAIAFTTVLGTVSGLIIAASGAVAHDLGSAIMKREITDVEKVKLGKWAAVIVGCIAIGLGILFKGFNVGFLVGWAFNVAASANLPALIMILYWKGVTKRGIMAGILVGLISSVIWILLSSDAFTTLYKLPASSAIAPFNQPAVITIPLGFLTIIAVSLVTTRNSSSSPK
jgi:cation/acetate symporter